MSITSGKPDSNASRHWLIKDREQLRSVSSQLEEYFLDAGSTPPLLSLGVTLLVFTTNEKTNSAASDSGQITTGQATASQVTQKY